MFVKALTWESEKPVLSFARNAAIVLMASFLIGLLGQIAIPLPFTPVPIVTQLQAVLLLGALLGSRRAAAAVFAFLLQGAMGLPVFANGGAGVAKLLGPTGGYLIGYLVAAFIVGAIVERFQTKTFFKNFAVISAGNVIVYILGAGYLSLLIGFQKALLLGIAPFLLGDLLKNIASAKLLHWMNK